MKNLRNCILIGFLIGIVIGEFFPTLIDGGVFHNFGAQVSDPFSRYRNHLAMHYGVIGAFIGAIVGLIAGQSKGRKK